MCVRAVVCVHYHLHWVCEHHTVEADEVLVVQGVHGVDLTDEVLQSVGLTQHISLQTLHRHVYLETRTELVSVCLLTAEARSLRVTPQIHASLQQECPHHLSCWRQPLSSLHDTKGAIPQLLKQRQILLWDEAGQSLLLPFKGCNPTTSARLRGQDSLPQAQRRCGRHLTKGGRRLALLGEVSSIWALSTKYLERG